MADDQTPGHIPDHIPDLPELARAGEEAARPLPADQVRRLGDRRRHRRYGAVAGGAIAAVVLAGGVLVGSTGLLRGGGGTVVPPVAATATPSAEPSASTEPPPSDPTSDPTPTVAPGRTVTTRNLLTVDDVPLEDRETTVVVVAKPSAGRAAREISRCWPSDRMDLDETSTVERNFRYEIVDPKGAADPGPLENQPVVYTQALQFADDAAAKRAQGAYADWLDECGKTLEAQQDVKVLPKLGFTNRSVPVSGGSATLSEVVYQRAGDGSGEGDGDNALWESVGLTRVDDRLMITVFLYYGMDFNVSLDRTEGELMHPQLTLIESAAEKLAG